MDYALALKRAEEIAERNGRGQHEDSEALYERVQIPFGPAITVEQLRGEWTDAIQMGTKGSFGARLNQNARMDRETGQLDLILCHRWFKGRPDYLLPIRGTEPPSSITAAWLDQFCWHERPFVFEQQRREPGLRGLWRRYFPPSDTAAMRADTAARNRPLAGYRPRPWTAHVSP